MHVSYDRPSNFAIASIDSTHNNAASITSLAYLTDGKVSVPYRFSWDVGTPDIGDSVTLTSVGGLNFAIQSDLVVWAMLMPKTPYAIPAGVWVDLIYTHGGTTLLEGQTVTLNNGATAIIGVASGAAGTTALAVKFKIWNSQGGASRAAGSTWATSGQTVDIGETYFGSLQEFKTTADPQYGLVDPTTNRRSHNNTPQPLYGKPYRTFSAPITPITDSQAYSGSNNFDAVRYRLSQCTACLVIPRLYTRGSTSSQDTNALAQLSIFGRPETLEPLTGVRDATGLWTSKLSVSEAPP